MVAYAVVIGVAFNLDHLFNITPEQAQTGKWVLLIIGIYVALNFPFGVYGGIISGFQRYDVNNTQAVITSIVVALVNAAVLLAGYGLITLVAATTIVRVLSYFIYRRNAFRVFPPLRIHPSLFRRSRLREVTGFSIYASIIDWANKLNYQLDQIIIGVFLGSPAVAVWAPAERIISGVQRLTNQLNGVLFPAIVDSDAAQKRERLQQIFLEGTRLSLLMVVPIATALIMLADPLVHAWLGRNADKVAGCIPVLQILAVAVAFRVGNATGNTLLKGAGEHRLVAWVNLGTGAGQRAAQRRADQGLRPAGRGLGHADPHRVLGRVHPLPCRLPPRRRAVDAGIHAVGPSGALAGVRHGRASRGDPSHLIRHVSGCCMSSSGWRRALPGAVLRSRDRQARPCRLPREGGTTDAAPPAPARRRRVAATTGPDARISGFAPTFGVKHAWDHPGRGQRFATERNSWRITQVPGQGRR